MLPIASSTSSECSPAGLIRPAPCSLRAADGHIVMPELPGIGFASKSDLIKVLRELPE